MFVAATGALFSRWWVVLVSATAGSRCLRLKKFIFSMLLCCIQSLPWKDTEQGTGTVKYLCRRTFLA